MTEDQMKEQIQAWQDEAAALRDMLAQAQDSNSTLVAEIHARQRKIEKLEAAAAEAKGAAPVAASAVANGAVAEATVLN